MQLKDMVEVIVDNSECVVLQVKENQKMNLISLGCFSGDEDLLRLTKGKTQTCTVFSKDGKQYSWHWGIGGHTLVSDATEKKGRMIERCIEQDFKILLKTYFPYNK